MDEKTIRKAEEVLLQNITAIRAGQYRNTVVKEWERSSELLGDLSKRINARRDSTGEETQAMKGNQTDKEETRRRIVWLTRILKHMTRSTKRTREDRGREGLEIRPHSITITNVREDDKTTRRPRFDASNQSQAGHKLTYIYTY